MKFRRPPLLLSMTMSAATMTLAVTVHGAWASSKTGYEEKKQTPSATPAPRSRMGAMIADDITKREETTRAETRALDLREQAAKAALARLNAALKANSAEATGNETQPSKTGATGKGRNSGQSNTGSTNESDPFDALARIYQAMKPAKAAPVFEQLDLEVQYLVVQRMRDRSAALLMAAMSPQGAARLTMRLAGRHTKTAQASPDQKTSNQ